MEGVIIGFSSFVMRRVIMRCGTRPLKCRGVVRNTASRTIPTMKENSPNTHIQDEIVLKIKEMSMSGQGIGHHCGHAIAVPYALPGETVKAKIRYFKNGNLAEARILEILESSPDRVEPQCRYFGECGGCQYQHVRMERQHQIKTQQVADLFAGIEKFPNQRPRILSVIATTQTYGYRTKINPWYSMVSKQSEGQPESILGFKNYDGSPKLVEVKRCALATERVNSALMDMHIHGPTIKPGSKSGSLIIRDNDDGEVATDYSTTVSMHVGSQQFQFKAGGFFQINKSIMSAFIDHVLNQAVGDDCTDLIDAYCGVGIFGIAAARYFENVYGIELDKGSIKCARENAVLNGIKNIAFFGGDSVDIFKNVPNKRPNQSVVIIDPPRKGCSEQFLDELICFRPKKIVYVSCDPSTHARDATILAQRGGYRLETVAPIDMFPQTKHIETVGTYLFLDHCK